MNRKLKLIFYIIVVILTIILLDTYFRNTQKIIPIPVFISDPSPSPSPLWFKKLPNPENVRCAADVKQCPDGSYVGRVAPLCSFAPCPGNSKY